MRGKDVEKTRKRQGKDVDKTWKRREKDVKNTWKRHTNVEKTWIHVFSMCFHVPTIRIDT